VHFSKVIVAARPQAGTDRNLWDSHSEKGGVVGGKYRSDRYGDRVVLFKHKRVSHHQDAGSAGGQIAEGRIGKKKLRGGCVGGGGGGGGVWGLCWGGWGVFWGGGWGWGVEKMMHLSKGVLKKGAGTRRARSLPTCPSGPINKAVFGWGKEKRRGSDDTRSCKKYADTIPLKGDVKLRRAQLVWAYKQRGKAIYLPQKALGTKGSHPKERGIVCPHIQCKKLKMGILHERTPQRKAGEGVLRNVC